LVDNTFPANTLTLKNKHIQKHVQNLLLDNLHYFTGTSLVHKQKKTHTFFSKKKHDEQENKFFLFNLRVRKKT